MEVLAKKNHGYGHRHWLPEEAIYYRDNARQRHCNTYIVRRSCFKSYYAVKATNKGKFIFNKRMMMATWRYHWCALIWKIHSSWWNFYAVCWQVTTVGIIGLVLLPETPLKCFRFRRIFLCNNKRTIYLWNAGVLLKAARLTSTMAAEDLCPGRS